MEPLSTAAIAIGTIIATSTLEKIGEQVGDTLLQRIRRFRRDLKTNSPNTAVAIEKASEQPVNYKEVILELEAVAAANPELKQEMYELVKAAEDTPPSNLFEILEEIDKDLKIQNSTSHTSIGKIDKPVNLALKDMHIGSQIINVV